VPAEQSANGSRYDTRSYPDESRYKRNGDHNGYGWKLLWPQRKKPTNCHRNRGSEKPSNDLAEEIRRWRSTRTST
jgi:hypothetical protein